MADGINETHFGGNLTEDPTLRFTQGGQAVLNLRIASNESYLDRDKNRKERTEYQSAVVWGARAEALSKFLRKGDPILVVGSLRTSSYEARDGGGKRYKTEINVRKVMLFGKGDGSGGGGNQRRDTQPSAPAPQYDAGSFGPDDSDDLPF